MKILFFSYAYPNPIHADLGTFNRTMIAGLANEHEVCVVSPVPFTDVWAAWAKGRLRRGLNDTTFQAVPGVRADYCPWYYTPRICHNWYGQFMRQSVRSRLARAIREFRPDIVLSYWTHPDGEVAVRTAHQFGIRAVAMVGGSDVLINARSGPRRDSILGVLQQADGVVTVSEDIRQVLISDGILADKLYVVRRGVDQHVFHPGIREVSRRRLGMHKNQPVIVSVGRLVDVKGHKHLIEACRLLAERGFSYRCYILGDGPLRPDLERQIEQSGLDYRVELKGTQSPAQLAEWYRAADLSVLPSLSEGVPNVLLESIACGTPFVASNVGGIPEVADPLLDRLVAAADPVALANALQEQLANASIPPQTRRRFEPPTMEHSADTLSLILQSVHSGQKLLKATDVVMHETMREADLTEASRPAVYSRYLKRAEAPKAETPETTDTPDPAGEVYLGRMGETFCSRRSVSPSSAAASTDLEAVVPSNP